LRNYQIEFDLIFLNVKNIILKLHKKLITRIEACNILNYAYQCVFMHDGRLWISKVKYDYVLLMVEWL
jgi:hypothetical protein